MASSSFKPAACVAIDFGTAATGYCIATPGAGGESSVRVYPFKPGDRGSAATEKNLTAVLLDGTPAMKVISVGREARRRFYEMDADEQRRYLYLEGFKMAMAPSNRGGLPLSARTVHGLGRDVAVSLQTATAKLLGFIRQEAVERAGALGVDAGALGWVLTVPAIWDDEAKGFMRAAAVEAGIVADAEDERLLLALEPEGAVIASAIDAPEALRKMLRVGERVMVLDCGGGTVDVTVSELVGADPPRLREILPASGGAWGGTSVDAQFRRFANELLVPQGTSLAGEREHAALSACADAWESAKAGWDPADSARDRVVVAGLASVCDWVGGAAEMAARVAAYNEKHGLAGEAAVVYRARSFSLVLPPGVVRGFFDACVEPICGHMQSLLVRAAEAGKPVSFVFLVGGFAESTYLQRAVREALETEDGSAAAHLVVPGKPVQCVNRGAAVFGLYPKSFIASRVAKVTYAVALCERYAPEVHDPVPSPSYVFTNEAGTWISKVLVPMVQAGEEVPCDHVVSREVSPVEDGQRDVAFAIFALQRRLPEIAGRNKRVYVLTRAVAASVPPALVAAHVSEDAEVCKVIVDVAQPPGGRPLPRAARTAQLSLFFGRTEITASAVSKTSGDAKKVTIRFDRALLQGGAAAADALGPFGPVA